VTVVPGVKLLRSGFGLRLQQQDTPLMEMIFDSKLELKKFCFAVYSLTKNESMREYCCIVGWEEEIGHFHEHAQETDTYNLNLNLTRESMQRHNNPDSTRAAGGWGDKSGFNRISFLAMNTRPSRSSRDHHASGGASNRHSHGHANGHANGRSHSRSRSRSNSPTPNPRRERSPGTADDDDDDRSSRSPSSSPSRRHGQPGALRREESFSTALDKVLGVGATATWRAGSSASASDHEHHKTDANKRYGHLGFSEPCLLLLTPSGNKKSKSGGFTRHVFQIYDEGFILFSQTKGQVAASIEVKPSPIKCSKFLCSKFESKLIKKDILKASNFLPNANDIEIAEVIIGIEIHEEKTGAVTKAYV
jgi:hypothetical protein